MAAAEKKIIIKVYGRVQGIFYRVSARKAAQGLGISLFALRNEPDGSVYMEAEGEGSALAQFVSWCRKGPPLAKVERVEVE